MLADRYIRTDLTSQEDFEKNFTLKVPEHFHFAYDVVDEYARISPDKRALIWCDLKGHERTFTFGEISRMSNQAANVFKAHGLKKGDPVILMLKRRWQFWVAAVGLLKLGCVLIPATAQLQKKDIVYRVQASSARAILCVEEPEVREHVLASAPECDTLTALFTLGDEPGFLDFDAEMAAASEQWDKPAELPKNDDIMLIYFTSGTTGMPKMAAHSWTYPIAQTVTAYYWHNVGDESIHMAVADTGWAKAGWGKLYGQWICGATLFVYDFDRFIAADLLKMLEKHRVTSFCAPPTVYRFLIKEDLSGYDLSALKWANCAGEPLNPEVYDQFLRLTGVKIHEGFGQSETTPLLMTSKWMEPKTGSTGRPSPAYDIALVDENGQDVDDGVEGEIVIRLDKGHPAGLFLGYYRNQEQTDAVFYNGMYHTGDMAWRDVDGYYNFIGRSDDVIKSSGYRIGPFEVESALLTHPAVLECAVTAVPHPDRGQVVKATVVLVKNRGYEPTDALKKELQNHVKQVTAPYKYPRIVKFWWDVDRAAATCVRARVPAETHGIRFLYQSGMMFIVLPSGRKLVYVKPKMGVNRYGSESVTYEGVGEQKKWLRLESYGPKFVENIVQATARDILVEAMRQLEAVGYQIVMHVHDEAVIEAPADSSLEDICAIMGQTPAWAGGLLLRADGYVCDFYQKD